MEFTLKLSDHAAHALCVDVLRDSLLTVRQEITQLQDHTDLRAHELQDLQNARQIEQHLVQVIAYFTPASEHANI
jgi:hypothetical protein